MVPVAAIERRHEHGAIGLWIAERRRLARALGRDRERRRQIGLSDEVSGREIQRALERVLQLADIARPMIREQQRERSRCEPLHRTPLPGRR